MGTRFGNMMSSYFDEMGRIMESKRGDNYKYDSERERPFSSTLTQDEEPTGYYPWRVPDQDPEVYIRLR